MWAGRGIISMCAAVGKVEEEGLGYTCDHHEYGKNKVLLWRNGLKRVARADVCVLFLFHWFIVSVMFRSDNFSAGTEAETSSLASSGHNVSPSSQTLLYTFHHCLLHPGVDLIGVPLRLVFPNVVPHHSCSQAFQNGKSLNSWGTAKAILLGDASCFTSTPVCKFHPSDCAYLQIGSLVYVLYCLGGDDLCAHAVDFPGRK